MSLFCFHEWSKWSEPIRTNYDCNHVQARYCTKCNKCQVKKVKQPWNTYFEILKSAEVLK